MARTKKTVVYQGRAGAVDCILDWPADTPRGWALVLHPHSEQGGTRDNKVVTTIARACVQAGLAALRPNMRGVGESAGTFDHGKGETQDMLEIIPQFLADYPQLSNGKWLLGGFSFGSAVAAHVYTALAADNQTVPDGVVLAGPAVQRFDFQEISLPNHTLLIHGEDDDVVPLAETMTYARDAELPVVVIPGAGHFFHGKLLLLKDLVEQRLKTM